MDTELHRSGELGVSRSPLADEGLEEAAYPSQEVDGRLHLLA